MTLRVCMTRGLDSASAIQEYLNPKLDRLKNPDTIRDMAPAVDRLVRARQEREFVRVFGDYDVDGTTGVALLSWMLREFGFRFDAQQPDRFKDGYGLNVAAVEEAAASGVRLLLTVDCGITSFDAAAKAQEVGVDLIVVDHHQLDPARGIPPAVAVIDPQRPDCESGLKQLCGCGLAFYLAMALRSRGRKEGWWTPGSEPNLKQHLDLVAMATAADLVPLIGDNRVLMRHGLEVLRFSKKPGVKALLQEAGLASADGKALSPGHLGFVIGPRINASGRMASANVALELLTTQDAARATVLAKELEKLNDERSKIQNRIWDEVRVRVEAGLKEGKFQYAVAVADESWHEGVVGIVASRVTEMFKKPAAVIAIRDGHAKGSVRSYGGKDVLAALRASAEHLAGFGGHKHAAGLSLKPENIDAFARAFDRALGELPDDPATRPLLLEGACSIDEFDVKTLQEFENLAPFGPGNPEPVFSFRATVASHQILKQRHLKLNLAENVSSIEAIWFHAAERSEIVDGPVLRGESIEWAGVPELNRFRGRVTPTIRVRDWRVPSNIS